MTDIYYSQIFTTQSNTEVRDVQSTSDGIPLAILRNVDTTTSGHPRQKITPDLDQNTAV